MPTTSQNPMTKNPNNTGKVLEIGEVSFFIVFFLAYFGVTTSIYGSAVVSTHISGKKNQKRMPKLQEAGETWPYHSGVCAMKGPKPRFFA